jgi:probable addiction module antidote protein
MGNRNVRKTHNLHLRDPEVAAEYMNDALESNDPAVILMAIRNVVDAREGGISELAEKTQLGRESMYKMLSTKGNPKLNTFSSVLHSLGFQLCVMPENRNYDVMNDQ